MQYDTETYTFQNNFYPGAYYLQMDYVNGYPVWLKEAEEQNTGIWYYDDPKKGQSWRIGKQEYLGERILYRFKTSFKEWVLPNDKSLRWRFNSIKMKDISLYGFVVTEELEKLPDKLHITFSETKDQSYISKERINYQGTYQLQEGYVNGNRYWLNDDKSHATAIWFFDDFKNEQSWRVGEQKYLGKRDGTKFKACIKEWILPYDKSLTWQYNYVSRYVDIRDNNIFVISKV